MVTWNDAEIPWQAPNWRLRDHVRGYARLAIVLMWTVLCGLVIIAIALIQKLTSFRRGELLIQHAWARGFLRIIGLRTHIAGHPAGHGGAIITNHSSWLDIVVICAARPTYFVAKEEVKSMAGIGLIAKLLKSEFIQRNPRKTPIYIDRLRARFTAGDTIVFYPEATTSDGMRILPYRPSFFEALCDPQRAFDIQPMVISYPTPAQGSPNFFALWGPDQEFPEHLMAVLRMPGRHVVDVSLEAPIRPTNEDDRNSLATRIETLTRERFTALRQARGFHAVY